MKRAMFLGADRLVFKNAEALRNNPTHAELILWSYLRQKPFGYKFRRQHPISIYVADFYCHPLKLIVEVDGKIHAAPDAITKDAERQRALEAEGISFIRFTNDQIEKDMNYVVRTLNEFVENSKSTQVNKIQSA
jgi:cyclase